MSPASCLNFTSIGVARSSSSSISCTGVQRARYDCACSRVRRVGRDRVANVVYLTGRGLVPQIRPTAAIQPNHIGETALSRTFTGEGREARSSSRIALFSIAQLAIPPFCSRRGGPPGVDAVANLRRMPERNPGPEIGCEPAGEGTNNENEIG